jgi:tRNA threonylcarbamoyladenosine biosynthesis protein TsaE
MPKGTVQISKNTKDTEKIAQDFLVQLLKQKHSGATVVGMYGDLGTGKTTFVKSIAKALGVTRAVSSPTFVIMKKYPIKSKNHTALIHIDAYRLKNAKELQILGWAEILANQKYVVFIEWPENVSEAMPKKHHSIYISHTKDEERNFKIKLLP